MLNFFYKLWDVKDFDISVSQSFKNAQQKKINFFKGFFCHKYHFSKSSVAEKESKLHIMMAEVDIYFHFSRAVYMSRDGKNTKISCIMNVEATAIGANGKRGLRVGRDILN